MHYTKSIKGAGMRKRLESADEFLVIYNALNSIQALVANDQKTEGIHYIGSFQDC